jgi:hypothetical protein
VKIIKSKKDLGTLKFLCKFCETEWELDSDEYSQVLSYEYIKSGTIFPKWTSTRSWQIREICPECENLVVKYIHIEEPKRIANPYSD